MVNSRTTKVREKKEETLLKEFKGHGKRQYKSEEPLVDPRYKLLNIETPKEMSDKIRSLPLKVQCLNSTMSLSCSLS